LFRGKDITEISDGRLYSLNDMVRVGCNDCRGCSSCCSGMGETIQLDPLDVIFLSRATGKTFDMMLDRELELNMVDGMILPNLKLDGGTGQCSFLNEEGRCSVHSFRPGICRIFPLGRYYHDGGFSYILQKDECRAKNRYKVRVRQWVDRPDPESYDRYILHWHSLIRTWAGELVKTDEKTRKDACMYFLNLFYRKPFREDEDLYAQLFARIKTAENFVK